MIPRYRRGFLVFLLVVLGDALLALLLANVAYRDGKR